MLARFNGNVVPFANDATSTNRTVFGGTTQSDNIDDNLNADFKKGWEIVGLNDNPTREDFNAMGYTLGALTSYLYQMGIAEYNALQEYKLNGLCLGTNGTIYQSLVDNNLGNALTNSTKWKNVTSSFVDLVNNQTIAGVKTFSSSPKVPTPTDDAEVANKNYVDNLRLSKSCINTNIALTFDGTNLSLKKGDQTSDNVNLSNLYGLGYGQTWQNVTASRGANVTYTNTTGKPIEVLIQASGTGNQIVTIDDETIVDYFTSGYGFCSFIVPNGCAYRINSGFNKWLELR